MSMSTQNEGQEQIDSINNDLDELYLLGGSSILIVYIEENPHVSSLQIASSRAYVRASNCDVMYFNINRNLK